MSHSLRNLHESSFALLMMDVDSAPSAARRRRERRLRQFLRHERLTVAMALAETLHHTSQGQKIARASEEENEMHVAMGQTTPPPRAEAAKLYPLTPGAEAGGQHAGWWPTRLVEVLLQVGLTRHAGGVHEHCAPMVQILDAPVLQVVNQLAGILMLFDTMLPDVEEVVEVPKIILDQIPMRLSLRDPQTAETVGESANSCVSRGCY